MKVYATDAAVVVDYERPDESWIVLVVDDMWHAVRQMLIDLGATESFDSVSVQAWFKERRRIMVEPFVRALLLLPSVIGAEHGVAKLLVAPFPPALTEGTILNAIADRQQVAALIDVQSSDGSLGFVKTWEVLDRTGVAPVTARAMFSRGGNLDALPPWCKDVPWIGKYCEERGTLAQEVGSWWQSVQGDLRTGQARFRNLTTRESPAGVEHAHGAGLLLCAGQDVIAQLLHEMNQYDTYGVWLWCREAMDAFGLELQRRWLAAKSFQYGAGYRGDDTPLLALVALVNGMAARSGAERYGVTDPLSQVTSEDVAREWEHCLGSLVLRNGTWGDCARALRRWMLHPEQRLPGNVHPVHLSLGAGEHEATIEIEYSGAMSADIRSGTGQGSASVALRAVSECVETADWLQNGTLLRLRFRWVHNES